MASQSSCLLWRRRGPWWVKGGVVQEEGAHLLTASRGTRHGYHSLDGGSSQVCVLASVFKQLSFARDA